MELMERQEKEITLTILVLSFLLFFYLKEYASDLFIKKIL